MPCDGAVLANAQLKQCLYVLVARGYNGTAALLFGSNKRDPLPGTLESLEEYMVPGTPVTVPGADCIIPGTRTR